MIFYLSVIFLLSKCYCTSLLYFFKLWPNKILMETFSNELSKKFVKMVKM